MKAILRNVVLAATAATAMAMSTAPATAAGVVTFTGTATIEHFGLGPSRGTAYLCVTGVIGTDTYVGAAPCTNATANADATFDLNEPSATCPATGSANGSVKTRDGKYTITFSWTRGGATAVISTSGAFTGAGTAAFKTDAPNPCGATNVTATFAGSVAGV